ncbi:MAG: hypothetical protein GX638_03755, partial [Crenarchaeota archaeon]|nr:hypothetical protein [Thermoproteota archaeon]
SGKLDNFSISVNERQIIIKDGSLCKWYLGNNFETLQRKDVQFAIEKLSDILHLPIHKATVKRIDVAQNFIMKYPVDVYYDQLGEKKYCKRVPVIDERNTTEGLYYYQNNKKGLCLFYNKVKEQKIKRQPIPDLYKHQNVLRYEQRYIKSLSKTFNVEYITASMLYDENFYKNIIDVWGANYKAIKKILNRNLLNFKDMDITTKKELHNIALLEYIQNNGGELVMIEQINNMQKMGKLTKKQAFDFRKHVIKTCKNTIGSECTNETIYELDKKINEAIKYYR